ncbi:MAG TPA: tetratricopeptide repeat protein [Bryobacteraceae bacterium]|nr:tetratricopeptide repeat protein [Bryobacteraceae bacterium]
MAEKHCDADLSAALAARARAGVTKHDAAVTLFRQALEACPQNDSLGLEISRALAAQRRFDEAIATAQEYVRRHPDAVPGLLILANALFMAQRWEECSPVLERALKLEPENAAALLLRANNDYLLGDTAKSEQILLRLLDRNPADIEAAYTLGRIYYMDNRPDFALGQFQRVVKLDPKHYKAWDNLGLCYDATGNSEMAIRHFLTAIRLVETEHPDYDWPYANLAELLLRQNRPAEAHQAALKAAERNPRSARNFYLGGQALIKLDRQREALPLLERAVTLDAAYPEPLYTLGQLYLRLGDKEKATTTLQRFREVKERAPKKRR